ncbi:helix-turn-helix transcriptional regulator [Streptococcus iniae]|uniref:helix-turn-helix domain-containing protein n=1 Tax=Streptococcus iniae TaxID=1346 RepID=UPI000EFC70B1|nr:helix-turn-helix transcriptional regulator [Streptococcus iniae]RMI79762.1 transcriptional regulator [Streptococcus iniae]
MKVFDGAKVKENRKRFNLTQYELSAMTNITQARISDIERNVTTVRSEEIISLSRALTCDKDDFYSDKQDVKVIMNTFKKGKKEVNSTKQRQITFPPYSENIEYGIRKHETKQLELFDEKSLIGQDLTGFVLITSNEYQKLLDAKKRLEKFENIFSEVKNG